MESFERGLHSKTICAIVASLFAATFQQAGAEDASGIAGVELHAEEFEIVEGGDVMIAVGNVRAKKGSILVTADRVVAWTGKSEMYAEGNVTLKDGDVTTIAPKMLYDWANQKALIFDVEFHNVRPGRPVNWHVTAERVEQQGKNVIKVKRAQISTCNFKVPHQHFSASSVVFKDKHSLAFKNALFRVHKIPVFYMPYYYRDLKYPWPWYHFGFGTSSEFGEFVKNDFGMEILPGVNLLLDFDYYAKRGTGKGLNLEYEGSRRIGYLDTYFIEDDGEDFKNTALLEDDRYRIRLLHRELLTATGYDALADHDDGFFIGRWTADVEFQDFSDINFYNEYFEYESRLQKEPESQLFLRGVWENASFSVLGKIGVDEFPDLSQSEQRSASTNVAGQTEYLPRVAYDLLSQPIWGGPLLFTFGAEYARLGRRFDNGLGLGGADLLSNSREIDRLDVEAELSAPFRINFLHVEPFIFSRETYFSELLADTNDEFRTSYGAGLRLSSEFWRLFDIENERWRINGLMHRMSPEITFLTVQDVDNSPDELIFFDDVDSLEPVDRITLNLFNVLETKRNDTKYRLMEFDVLTNYFPNSRRDNNNKSFSVVETDLRWYVHPRLYVFNDNEISTDPILLEIMNAGFSATPISEFSVSVSQRYSRDDSNRTIWSATVTPSPLWSINLRQDYEWNEKQFFDFQLTLGRRFHDWILEFGFDEDQGRDDRTFFFFIGPRAAIESGGAAALRSQSFLNPGRR